MDENEDISGTRNARIDAVVTVLVDWHRAPKNLVFVDFHPKFIF